MAATRRLEKDEIIQAGDEIDRCANPWHDDPKWEPVHPDDIGRPAPDPQFPAHRQYRRQLSDGERWKRACDDAHEAYEAKQATGTDAVVAVLRAGEAAAEELATLRATLLVNFGPDGRSMPGIASETQGTLKMLVGVLEHRQAQLASAAATIERLEKAVEILDDTVGADAATIDALKGRLAEKRVYVLCPPDPAKGAWHVDGIDRGFQARDEAVAAARELEGT